jgi:hypothetical protein
MNNGDIDSKLLSGYKKTFDGQVQHAPSDDVTRIHPNSSLYDELDRRHLLKYPRQPISPGLGCI